MFACEIFLPWKGSPPDSGEPWSSEPRLHGNEELTRRAAQQRLRGAVRIGRRESVRVDGAEVLLVRDIRQVGLNDDLVRRERFESVPAAEIDERVGIDTAIVEIRVE